MPSYTLKDEDLTDGSIDILSLLYVSGLVPSKSEARRAVQQGGVSVNGEKVTDIKTSYTASDFAEDMVLKKGKKKLPQDFEINPAFYENFKPYHSIV